MTPNNGIAPPQNEPEGTHAHLNLRLGNQQHPAHPSSSGMRAQDRAPPPPGSGHPTPAPLGMKPSNTSTRTVGISNLPRIPQHNSALTPDNQNDHSSHQQQENDGPRPRVARPNEQRASPPPSPPYISDEEFEALKARSGILKEQEERKASIPGMVPGFKANPLTHGDHLSLLHSSDGFLHSQRTYCRLSSCAVRTPKEFLNTLHVGSAAGGRGVSDPHPSCLFSSV
ncbi:hypothetical protein M422DRAFT_51617 [Sphaerobolus stellatus SS14]|uniref:Uncharacterized protein n=1 Tax=Sphaerobolus stellatus (strain SS14) TaxID=990650 RepID=A0A0C9TX98_SPHS4|nr:hypothetical protein M422DRAFT_51617 [Sphaerobolus stellatus SS14]